MQNFTLGKKGYAMLLFALILLIGSSPTYGQCPVPADDNAATAGNQQSFCALATVSELEIEDFDGVDPDNVRWYRNATSNTAIPDNEILRTQRYFAGNGSNTCTARQFVDVTVDDIGVPTADFGNIYSPCEYTPGGTSTVQDLIDSVVGNDIQIYEEEFTGDALNPNELLVEGRSYFADQKNPDTDCRSSRLALRYEPVLAEAPTAEPVQTFCPGATVADLVAQPTSDNQTAFRWYSTATSNPQLPSSTPLINGETYYASQIVNRENSPLPPCESIDRAEVTVVFQDVTPLESTQVFCVDPDDASTNPRVEDLVSPYGTRFFADANFTQLLAPQVLLVDDEDYFTANGDPDTCEATRVVVDLVEIPNAGEDVNETVCETELDNPAALIARFNELLVGRDSPGTFTDSNLTELGAQFLANPIGVFTTTYTVDNGSCTDSAQITVTVIEATPAEAGDDQELAFCSTDGVQNLFDFLSADANPNGTFTFDSNGNEVPNGNFDPASFGGQTVEITYTVDGDTPPCTVGSDTADFEIEVTQAEPANAGGPVSATYCENENEDVSLVSLLDSDANTTGSFSAPFESGIFNPADQGAGTYTITYNLDESEDCVTGTDATTITITVREIEEADAGEPVVASFCVTETQDVQLTSLLAAGINPLGSFEAPFEDGIFNPASAGVGVFEFNYTLDGAEDCVTGTSTTSFTITVREVEEAEAGEPVVASFCVTETQDVQLTSLLADGINTLGSFEAPFEDGIFNPASSGVGVFEFNYTLDGAEDCVTGTSTTSFTITVREVEEADAGEPVVASFCVTETQDVQLTSLLADGINTLGSFEAPFEDGIFNPASAGVGVFEFNYTLDGAEDCVTGTSTTSFTITVREVKEADAGAPVVASFCVTETQDVQLTSLLADGVNTLGSFEAPFEDGVFNPASAGVGVFEFDYTLDGAEDCVTGTSTTSFTITVREVEEADAGAPVVASFCVTETQDIQLTSLLADGVNTLGSFEAPFEDGVFNPASAGVGVFEFDYTLDGAKDCVTGTSTTSFTITVREVEEADAGDDVAVTYCQTENTNINLIDLLSQETNPLGSFSAPYEDGVFNPFEAGVGEIEIIYTLEGSSDCVIGTSSSTITITVEARPDAPTGEVNQNFCLSNNPTVEDLAVSGNNLVIFSDVELTLVLDETTSLIDGAVYYVVANNDAGTCSSNTTAVIARITDPAAPTVSTDGDEFCRSDNPTVQDLINNFTGSGVLVYTSSTGGSPLAATTALENGVTYYGASLDATTGCESSERIAVVAKVEFCGIPEGFSPNGDGINDRFVIPDIAENFPNYSIEIFNRWGNVVFKGNANTGDWDGISNQSGTLGDDVLPVGVYFYILNYNDGQTSPVQGKLYLSI